MDCRVIAPLIGAIFWDGICVDTHFPRFEASIHFASLYKVKLPNCVARRPLTHKVNLPRCEARRRHFIWYFGHRTNEHVRSMLFIRIEWYTLESTGEPTSHLAIRIAREVALHFVAPLTEIDRYTLDKITTLVETNHTISLAFKTFS